jgi:hypothetical protein
MCIFFNGANKITNSSRKESLTSRILGLWVRIPLGGCIIFACVVLSAGLENGRYFFKWFLKDPCLQKLILNRNRPEDLTRKDRTRVNLKQEEQGVILLALELSINLVLVEGGSRQSFLNFSNKLKWTVCIILRPFYPQK